MTRATPQEKQDMRPTRDEIRELATELIRETLEQQCDWDEPYTWADARADAADILNRRDAQR